MPNWLIPTGELLFTGSEKALHAAIGALEGKAQGENRFSVTLGGGAASFRFKMKTRFRCHYEKAPGGYAISWQAWPGLSAIWIFLILAALCVLGLIWGELENTGWLACLLGLLVFLYAIQRGNSVQQFAAAFTK